MISTARRVFLCFVVLALLLGHKGFASGKKASSALSHFIMGRIYSELGELDKSVQEYQRSIKLDPQNSITRLNLAATYIKNNSLKDAIEELNLAIRIEPEAVEPHAVLALLYAANNQRNLFEKEYEIALKNASKLKPSNIDIYKSLAAMYLKQKRLDLAADTYKLILDLSPSDAEAYFYLGGVYYELNERAAAEEQLKKAIQIRPDYAEALNYLGYLYLEENKNINEAEILIRKALEINPDNGAYVDSLGWFYFKKGQIQEAIRELEKAVLLMEDAIIYDHLGDAYYKANDFDNAKLNWQKSLELDASRQDIKEKIENAVQR